MEITFQLGVRPGDLRTRGRSGTGKSVLLKLLIGLEAPDSARFAWQATTFASASLQELNEAS